MAHLATPIRLSGRGSPLEFLGERTPSALFPQQRRVVQAGESSGLSMQSPMQMGPRPEAFDLDQAYVAMIGGQLDSLSLTKIRGAFTEHLEHATQGIKQFLFMATQAQQNDRIDFCRSCSELGTWNVLLGEAASSGNAKWVRARADEWEGAFPNAQREQVDQWLGIFSQNLGTAFGALFQAANPRRPRPTRIKNSRATIKEMLQVGYRLASRAGFEAKIQWINSIVASLQMMLEGKMQEKVRVCASYDSETFKMVLHQVGAGLQVQNNHVLNCIWLRSLVVPLKVACNKKNLEAFTFLLDSQELCVAKAGGGAELLHAWFESLTTGNNTAPLEHTPLLWDLIKERAQAEGWAEELLQRVARYTTDGELKRAWIEKQSSLTFDVAFLDGTCPAAIRDALMMAAAPCEDTNDQTCIAWIERLSDLLPALIESKMFDEVARLMGSIPLNASSSDQVKRKWLELLGRSSLLEVIKSDKQALFHQLVVSFNTCFSSPNAALQKLWLQMMDESVGIGPLRQAILSGQDGYFLSLMEATVKVVAELGESAKEGYAIILQKCLEEALLGKHELLEAELLKLGVNINPTLCSLAARGNYQAVERILVHKPAFGAVFISIWTAIWHFHFRLALLLYWTSIKRIFV
jgi:hypothetical protein